MNDLERRKAAIEAIMADIERLQAGLMGAVPAEDLRDPDDCEAYETVRRIIKKIDRGA
jgi:hypothetical protein